jgi:hypothetical protein
MPPQDGWTEKATALLAAVNEIARTRPENERQITFRWSEAAAAHPGLAGLDGEKVCHWLERRLLGHANEVPAEPPLPCMEVAALDKRRGREPFAEWLFSRAGLRIKLQGVLAAGLLASAGLMAFSESRALGAREAAWNAMHKGSLSHDAPAVVAAAENFFSTRRPVREPEDREEAARELYAEALVQWFARQPGSPSAELIERARRFGKIAGESGRR